MLHERIKRTPGESGRKGQHEPRYTAGDRTFFSNIFYIRSIDRIINMLPRHLWSYARYKV